jgi:MFS family permease
MQYRSYFHLFSGMAMLELGNLASALAPFNVSAVSVGLGANSQESGLVVTLELFFAAISSLYFGTSQYKGRNLGLIGSLMVMICYYLCSVASDVNQITIIKAFSGLGCGMLIASGHSILASSQDPNRTYAVFTLFSSIMAALLIYISSSWIEDGGHQNYFFNFIYIYIALTLFFFLSKQTGHKYIDQTKHSIDKKLVYFLLIMAVLLYEIPSSGMWAFMERFGVQYLDMSVSEVGSAIAIAIILSLIGPVFIGIFGNKIRRKETILFCLFVSSICVYAIFGIPSIDTFYYGNIIWNIVFIIMVILILAAAADIDPTGRLGAWLNACILLSASLAPAVFGWVMLENEMTVIYPYLLVFLFIAMVCILNTKKELEPIDKV